MSNKSKSVIKMGRGVTKSTKRAAKDRKPSQREGVDDGEIGLLAALRHPEPHRILGAHPTPAGVVIRAFRPNANRIEVVVGRKGAQALHKIHPAGLFELLLPGFTTVPEYRLRVVEGDRTATFRDPYSFMPTLGDLDLHLFAEGRHEAIYEKLGSHVHKVAKDVGVSFAVWAPHAEGVSVVGTFNDWKGTAHQMRRLGGSGVWELFIPDLGPGTLYKYEIRAGGISPIS